MPQIQFLGTFPDLDKNRIKISFNQIPSWVDRCVVDLQGGAGSPIFLRWFDNGGDVTRWNKVKSVFTTMQEWMTTKTFYIQNTGALLNAPVGVMGAVKMASTIMGRSCSGGGTVATGYQGASHVGSGVRMYLDLTGVNDQKLLGLTLVHECCHKIDNSIIDYHPGGNLNQAYNAAWCAHWAGTDPDNAVRNAENYALYCGDVNKKLSFLRPKCDGNILPLNFAYTDGTQF